MKRESAVSSARDRSFRDVKGHSSLRVRRLTRPTMANNGRGPRARTHTYARTRTHSYFCCRADRVGSPRPFSSAARGLPERQRRGDAAASRRDSEGTNSMGSGPVRSTKLSARSATTEEYEGGGGRAIGSRERWIADWLPTKRPRSTTIGALISRKSATLGAARIHDRPWALPRSSACDGAARSNAPPAYLVSA